MRVINTDKAIKGIIGVGALTAAYIYMSGSNETSGSSSQGNFGGLGGGGESLSNPSDGVSSSETPFNINFPEIPALTPIFDNNSKSVSDSGISKIIPNETPQETPQISSKKRTVSDDVKETNGSLSSSLAQVFGSENQKTNNRGDYYTTPAGGGAGEIKGQSIGETVFAFLSNSYKDSKTEKGNLSNGSSTSISKYNKTDIDLKAVLQADQSKKAKQLEAIKETKLASPQSPGSLTDYINTGGVLTSSNGNTISKKSSGNSKTQTTTKKESSQKTYQEGGNTKYKGKDGKVHVVVKSKKR